MTLLLVGLAALLVGPILVACFSGSRHLRSGLDGFVLVAICGLLLVHIIPDSIEVAGWWAVAAAVVGIFLPQLAEGALFHHGHHDDHGHHSRFVSVLALLGLAVHSFLDGAALTAPGTEHGLNSMSALTLGVLLHRIPTGLAIWSVASTIGGRMWAGALLGLVALGTTLGFFAGAETIALLPTVGLSVFQALVAGTFIHVVFHAPIAEGERSQVGATVGTILAVASLWFMADHGGHHEAHHAHESGLDVFTTMALESAPALLIAFIAAGLLRAFLRSNAVAWLSRGGALLQSLRGMAFGLPLPICSCGVVPLYRSLVVSGAPATASFTFLIATPELGLDALLITLPLLGADMMVARIVAAVVVALTVGLVVGRLARGTAPNVKVEPEQTEESDEPLSVRVRDGLRYGLSDLVDDTLPWILAGLILAALLEPFLDPDAFTSIPAYLELPLFALLGMPLYVCAAGATPIVAVLLFKGISPGAAIAFLLTGPATNVTTFGVLKDLYGRTIAIGFGVTVTLAAVGTGALVNLAIPEATGISLDAAGHGAHGATWEWIPLGLLTLLLLGSLLRQGPRGVIAQVLPGVDDHEPAGHDHDHGEPETAASCCGTESPAPPPPPAPKDSCCH